MTVRRGHGEEIARSVDPAFAAPESFIEFDSTCLLEEIDDGVRIGSERHGHADVGEPVGGADAVTEIPLGRRTHHHRRARHVKLADVVVSEVRGVDGAEALREHAGVGEQPDR